MFMPVSSLIAGGSAYGPVDPESGAPLPKYKSQYVHKQPYCITISPRLPYFCRDERTLFAIGMIAKRERKAFVTKASGVRMIRNAQAWYNRDCTIFFQKARCISST
jgi:hypothetical protein